MGGLIISIEGLVHRFNLDLGAVLHLGAHLGEEASEYQRAGATSVTWVEADPALFGRLEVSIQPFGHRAVRALVTDRDDEEAVLLLASNDGRSSSILPMKTHKDQHPEVMVTGRTTLRTTTVDTLCDRYGIRAIDLMSMDLQGAELLAIQGAAKTLEHARYVYTEVNVEELYEGCAMIEAVDAALPQFVRQETALTRHGWGDAFYIRSGLAPRDVAPRTWIADPLEA